MPATFSFQHKLAVGNTARFLLLVGLTLMATRSIAAQGLYRTILGQVIIQNATLEPVVATINGGVLNGSAVIAPMGVYYVTLPPGVYNLSYYVPQRPDLGGGSRVIRSYGGSQAVVTISTIRR